MKKRILNQLYRVYFWQEFGCVNAEFTRWKWHCRRPTRFYYNRNGNGNSNDNGRAIVFYFNTNPALNTVAEPPCKLSSGFSCIQNQNLSKQYYKLSLSLVILTFEKFTQPYLISFHFIAFLSKRKRRAMQLTSNPSTHIPLQTPMVYELSVTGTPRPGHSCCLAKLNVIWVIHSRAVLLQAHEISLSRQRHERRECWIAEVAMQVSVNIRMDTSLRNAVERRKLGFGIVPAPACTHANLQLQSNHSHLSCHAGIRNVCVYSVHFVTCHISRAIASSIDHEQNCKQMTDFIFKRQDVYILILATSNGSLFCNSDRKSVV